MKDGKPAYTYNFLGLSRYTVAAPSGLRPGRPRSCSTSRTTAAEWAKGGEATLSVNGQQVAKGRIDKTQPYMFSADETADVGLDNQTPVAEGIGIGRMRPASPARSRRSR